MAVIQRKSERWVEKSLLILTVLWIYVSVQNSLFANGHKDFLPFFHNIDETINSFLNPAVFFFCGAFFSQYKNKVIETGFSSFCFDRLLYVFIVWVFLQNFVEVVFSGYTGSAAVFVDIYFDLVSEPSNHLWLIVALLVNLTVLRCVTNIQKPETVTLIFVSAIAGYLYQNYFLGLYPLNYLLEYFVFIYSGSLFYKIYRECAFKKRRHALYLIVFILLLYWGGHYFFQINYYKESLIALFLAFVGVVFLLAISKLISNMPVSLCGVAEMIVIIFLCQFTVVGGIREVLHITFDYENTYGNLFFGVLLGVLSPLVVYFLRHQIFISWLFSPPKVLSYKFISHFIYHYLLKVKVIRVSCNIMLFLLVFGYFIVYAVSEYRLNSFHSAGGSKLAENSRADLGLSEGGRLSMIYGCSRSCHGEHLEGKTYNKIPLRMVSTSPNLTRSVSNYTDDELSTMIRTGFRTNGKPLVAGMPTAGYSMIPDEHLSLILAFLRAQPKVSKETEEPRIGLLSRLQIAAGSFPYQHVLLEEAQKVFVKYDDENLNVGQRWVRANCTECHGHLLQGNPEEGIPSLVIARAYSFELFKRLLRTGVKLNGEEAGLMGTVAQVRFSNFTDKEIESIYNYLMAFQPVSINNEI